MFLSVSKTSSSLKPTNIVVNRPGIPEIHVSCTGSCSWRTNFRSEDGSGLRFYCDLFSCKCTFRSGFREQQWLLKFGQVFLLFPSDLTPENWSVKAVTETEIRRMRDLRKSMFTRDLASDELSVTICQTQSLSTSSVPWSLSSWPRAQ